MRLYFTINRLVFVPVFHPRPSRGSHRGAGGGSQWCDSVPAGSLNLSQDVVAPSAAQRELSAHPPGTRERTRPALAQLKAAPPPPGTGALGRCVRLATMWLRSSGSAQHPRPPPPPSLLRLLLLLSGLVQKGAAGNAGRRRPRGSC